MDNAARQRLYRHRFSERDRRRKARMWAVLVRDYLQRWVEPGDAVLDLGCGDGEFLAHVRCARRIGVDENPDARRRLGDGVEFHLGGICDLSFLPDASVDLVFTSNVLEHLPGKGDVERALLEARRVLRPGGQLIALGPNLRFLPGSYWDFWDHRVPITDRSLVELLETLDFRVVERIARFLPHTTCSPLPKAPWLLRLYLRLPLLWRLLGRQFLVRAARP